MYKKILLPTDGSEFANRAADHTISIAGCNNAEILVYNVMETSKLPEIPADYIKTENTLMHILTDEAKKAFTVIRDKLKKSDNVVKATFKIEQGSPADMILKKIEDENIDLVVMGTAGKHGLDRFWFGSVAENVVRYSKCPVMVVH